MLTYEIEPGKGAGIFQLGDSLWHILDELRTRKTEYPKVEVAYDPDNATKTAVTVHLPDLTLYFPHSLHQTLQQIIFPALGNATVSLSYDNRNLHSASSPLTKARASKLFGPTYAGGNGSKLAYPGISFEVAGGGGADGAIGKLSVVPRDDRTVPLLSPLVSCVIQPGRGVTLHIPDILEIVIGQTTSQDLLLDLGPPVRRYWKEDDRMERMWGSGQTGTQAGSCFWNYFQHGLDFLISPDGLVEKIVCHSNIPGTPAFQRYARCPWTIPDQTDSAIPARDFTSPSRSSRQQTESPTYPRQQHLTVPEVSAASDPHTAVKSGGSKKTRTPSPASVSAGSSEGGKETETVSLDKSQAPISSAATGQEVEDAMVLDRSVEGGLEGVIGLSTSWLIGSPGVIFEEDRRSGGTVSVLVFKQGGP